MLPDGEPVDGCCHIDASGATPVGNPALVASCPDTERRILRFVGKGRPRQDAMVFVTCGSPREPVSEECSR